MLSRLLLFLIFLQSKLSFGINDKDIDIHGDKDWKCLGDIWKLPNSSKILKQSYNPRDASFHVSKDKEIESHYPEGEIPNRGAHRQKWGVYGEHLYLPPGHYVHNLEHGGVVFMFHPCTSDPLVNQLRCVAKSCTWRHIITRYPHLTKEYPVAVLTYAAVYRMSRINATDVRLWVAANQINSPEVDVYGQGTYNNSLLEISEIPENPQNESFCDIKGPPCQMESTELPQAVPVLPMETNTRPTATPRTEEAAWAVGSLIFLLTMLTFGLCYTKLWQKRYGSGEGKAKAWSDNSSTSSLNVAAVVRNFPHILSKKPTSGGYVRNSTHYSLIDDVESYSEEEI